MDSFSKEAAACLLRAVATYMSGMYFGGTFYCSIVECKARLALSPASRMVDHFQEHFPRALSMCQMQGVIMMASGVAAYFLAPDHPQSKYMLGAVLTTLALFPYTYACIMPLNKLLMDGDVPKKKDDSWIVNSMKKWESMHFVRTVFAGAAFAITLYSYVGYAK